MTGTEYWHELHMDKYDLIPVTKWRSVYETEQKNEGINEIRYYTTYVYKLTNMTLILQLFYCINNVITFYDPQFIDAYSCIVICQIK